MLNKYPPTADYTKDYHFQYYDDVQNRVVDALVHWVTSSYGSLMISFPGRNPKHPEVRAGAIVPTKKCRPTREKFLKSQGSCIILRDIGSFQHKYYIHDFELFMIITAADRSETKYPDTYLVGRFKDEQFSSIFTRSTFLRAYELEDVEELLAKQRECDGSPHPRKAVENEWVPSKTA
ncbi:hypothetical protein F5Y02DRAFT_389785 [Annulohypoxylon stygium]|nr:hypothetical protein F5Y02DRAFT_389785 [Annulohypoxylon stygium]